MLTNSKNKGENKSIYIYYIYISDKTRRGVTDISAKLFEIYALSIDTRVNKMETNKTKYKKYKIYTAYEEFIGLPSCFLIH